MEDFTTQLIVVLNKLAEITNSVNPGLSFMVNAFGIYFKQAPLDKKLDIVGKVKLLDVGIITNPGTEFNQIVNLICASFEVTLPPNFDLTLVSVKQRQAIIIGLEELIDLSHEV